jgi:hypothetical protein
MKKLLFAAILLTLAGPATAETYNGYECTDDCSGHEAGYEWAEQNDIDDDTDCSTASESFNEGCSSYVEENEEEDEDDY